MERSREAPSLSNRRSVLLRALFFTAAFDVLAVSSLVALNIFELTLLVSLSIELAITATAVSRAIRHDSSPPRKFVQINQREYLDEGSAFRGQSLNSKGMCAFRAQ